MTSIPLDNPGGQYLVASQYVRPGKDTINAIASMGNVALLNLILGRLLSSDGETLTPGVIGDDLTVSDSSGNVAVAPGLAFVPDESVTDPHAPIYRPCVLAGLATLEVAEPDDTNDRIDIVSIAPDTTDDTEESVWVRSGEGLSQQDLATRRIFSAVLTVTTGTPGAGAPSTPEGHVKLAEVTVAASTGALTVTDCRPILNLTRAVRPVPGEPYVVEGLTPSLSSGAVMVATGIAEVGGYRFRYEAAGPLTATENATGANRYDLITAKDDGTIALIAGDGDVPTLADEPAGSVLLGYATVPTGGSTVSAVTDLRETGTIGAAQLRAGAVTTGKIAADAVDTTQIVDEAVTTAKLAPAARGVTVQLTYGSYSAANDRHTIEAQIVDAEGNAISGQTEIAFTCRDAAWDEEGVNASQLTISAGAPFDISASGSRRLIRTGSDGSVEILVTHPASPAGSGATIYLEAQPVGVPGGPGRLAFKVDAAP